MRGFGVGALILGYCAWYTLYQKTWGDGTGFLYNLTGSSRFQGTATTTTNTSPTSTSSTPTTGPGGAPTPVVPGTPVIVK